MSEKVVVGLSGGVDSAVTAYLLKQQGYDVIGVTMQIWKENVPQDEEVSGISAIDDARKIAEHLDIPYYVLNFKDVFQEKVINYFIDSYNHGKTPNPCIRCNRYVKWEALLKKANEFGAKYVATGHYAQIKQLENGRYALCKSITDKKDQTYALCNLSQDQLAHTMMPLGLYEKEEIRKIAKEAGIVVADKPDSQDICFVEDGKYANFIWHETGERAIPGNFVTPEGEVIGRHKGIIFYTVGQRKGLNLSLGKRLFVSEIRPETNEVVVTDNESLFTTEVYAERVNFMGAEGFDKPTRAFAKIRYGSIGGYCTVEMISQDIIKCVFDEPQRAVTPGQALVVYGEEAVLCGAEIIKYTES